MRQWPGWAGAGPLCSGGVRTPGDCSVRVPAPCSESGTQTPGAPTGGRWAGAGAG